MTGVQVAGALPLDLTLGLVPRPDAAIRAPPAGCGDLHAGRTVFSLTATRCGFNPVGRSCD